MIDGAGRGSSRGRAAGLIATNYQISTEMLICQATIAITLFLIIFY
jgi:hypothetical protein